MKIKELAVSAPGRICLFGEHQDYLGLPVITAAINLRITISGRATDTQGFYLDLPDLASHEKIDCTQPIHYRNDRDYFRSGLNVLLRQNVKIPCGYHCTVRGNIPINSGTSSSSALVIAWVKFLLTLAQDPRRDDPLAIARLAHQAEVLEFNEPGGMMDHFAASFGSILYIDFGTSILYIDFGTPGGEQVPLPARLGHFVLGDSHQPKDTRAILARVKHGTQQALTILSLKNPELNIHTLSIDRLDFYSQFISPEQHELLIANVINRELTQQAKKLLLRQTIDHQLLGELLCVRQLIISCSVNC